MDDATVIKSMRTDLIGFFVGIVCENFIQQPFPDWLRTSCEPDQFLADYPTDEHHLVRPPTFHGLDGIRIGVGPHPRELISVSFDPFSGGLNSAGIEDIIDGENHLVASYDGPDRIRLADDFDGLVIDFAFGNHCYSLPVSIQLQLLHVVAEVVHIFDDVPAHIPESVERQRPALSLLHFLMAEIDEMQRCTLEHLHNRIHLCGVHLDFIRCNHVINPF